MSFGEFFAKAFDSTRELTMMLKFALVIGIGSSCNDIGHEMASISSMSDWLIPTSISIFPHEACCMSSLIFFAFS